MIYRTLTSIGLALTLAACGGDGGGDGTTFGTAATDDTTATLTATATATATATDSGGTESTTGVPTTGGSEDPEDAMRALIQAKCDWYFNCCSPGELEVLVGPFTGDAAECTDRVMDALAAGNMEPPVAGGPSDLLLYVIFAVNNGRAELNAGAVAQCVDQLSMQECTSLPGDPSPFCTPPDAADAEDLCAPERLFIGIQTAGEDCSPTLPYECAPGLKCIPFGEVGVCAQPNLEGENCFDDDDCATDLLCDFQAGTCAVPSALGGPCSYSNPAAPLPGTEAQRCEPGLSCNPVDGVCVGPCDTGSPCTVDGECPESHVCALGLCQMPLPTDAPCEENPDCSSNICDPVAQACSPLITLGQPCTASGQCETGWCDNVTLVCGPQQPAGGACASGQAAQCQPGNRCTALVCTAIPGIGQVCDPATNPCDTGIVCTGGTCVEPPLLNGASCTLDTECVSGLCYFDFCSAKGLNGEVCGDMVSKPCGDKSFCAIDAGATSGVCEMAPVPGDPCETSTECAGTCIVAWGLQMCDATPFPGSAWCDGM
jgi:hypothetical protein